MHNRYVNKKIEEIFSDQHKLNLWQETELVVLAAKAQLKQIKPDTCEQIKQLLLSHPIDFEIWQGLDKLTKHDLNAFLMERRKHLPTNLQPEFHKSMTSYDTEEPAWAIMLKEAYNYIVAMISDIKIELITKAKTYRYLPMIGRTHGQEAQLQSFGKRCLTWLQEISMAEEALLKAAENLSLSKLSGAIGNYGGLDPEVEQAALKLLGLEPYYGATQIMPRALYTPLANALSTLVCSLNKIALDIRLGARSGRPIFQEPFAKNQKGSSAMPHKKNTIMTEQMEGMQRMALGYLQMIMQNISTWEERAIEQSCVERVAWPDLFHVACRALDVMTKVLSGMEIYPVNMMWEIINSRGCYASNEAKEFLAEIGLNFNLTVEDAYRIIQLAAFNSFDIVQDSFVENFPPRSWQQCEKIQAVLTASPPCPPVSIEQIISEHKLIASEKLSASTEQVECWNEMLEQIFAIEQNKKRWSEIFSLPYLLRHEETLYLQILGE